MNLEYTDNIIYSILDRFETSDFRGFLTGKGNFRNEVTTYKANRDPNNRPRYYKEIREYLIAEWRAEVTEGIEADDALALNHDGNTVICSTDKDLRTLPGYFYNIATGELEHIDETQAITNFLVQLMVGDKVDNIAGLPNPAKAHHKNPPNFTDATARELLTGTPDQNLAIISNLYKQQYGEQWEQIFNERAMLLWIQRKDAKTYKDCNLLYPVNV
jgi:hypothetical protein